MRRSLTRTSRSSPRTSRSSPRRRRSSLRRRRSTSRKGRSPPRPRWDPREFIKKLEEAKKMLAETGREGKSLGTAVVIFNRSSDAVKGKRQVVDGLVC